MNYRKLQKIILLLILFFPISAHAKTHKIEMLNSKDGQAMVFDPAYLKDELGDVVNFIPTNQGHNSQSIFVPKNGENWKGKIGEEISVTFTKEGIYIYQCSNHFVMGMIGVIQVGMAANLDEAKNFTKSYKSKLATNKDRLELYLKMAK